MAGFETVVPAALKGVYDRWHFAPAVISNGLIFCSGIVGTSVDGEAPVGAGIGGALEGARSTTGDPWAGLAALQAVRDPEAQFATAFEALAAILAEAGATLADLVELTTYHVDMARHMETFTRTRDRYLGAPWAGLDGDRCVGACGSRRPRGDQGGRREARTQLVATN
jgi:enamine deaminase RidA (YjgF/YER057c/UK114 family)